MRKLSTATATTLVFAFMSMLLIGCLGGTTAVKEVSVETEASQQIEIHLGNQQLTALLESRTVNAGNMSADETYFSFIETQFELAEDAVIEEGAVVMYPVAPATNASSEGALPTYGYNFVSAETAEKIAQFGISQRDLELLRKNGVTSSHLPIGNFGNLKAKETYFSLVEVPVVISGTLEEGSVVMYPVAPATEASSEGALPFFASPVR